MSQPTSSVSVIRPSLQLVRLPVEKPQAAVDLLHARSQGVMDLIAHFWERLPQTPPLQRNDLHLLVALPSGSSDSNINISTLDVSLLAGAMLFVPKAHRADVFAVDSGTAAAFASYIAQRGPAAVRPPLASAGSLPTGIELPRHLPGTVAEMPNVLVHDLSNSGRTVPAPTEIPVEPPASTGERVPIGFLSGNADAIQTMVPMLLPSVHRKSPARQLVNVVMQLPVGADCQDDPNVRPARDSDVPALNRWRRQYREERGILFDADLDAWVNTGRLFVYEFEKQVVAVAKFDLELPRLIEIGGVYTFPEFRKQGFGGKIVRDLACRIRQTGKLPTLQVDVQNAPAVALYETTGWRPMGTLARVWLTE